MKILKLIVRSCLERSSKDGLEVEGVGNLIIAVSANIAKRNERVELGWNERNVREERKIVR